MLNFSDSLNAFSDVFLVTLGKLYTTALIALMSHPSLLPSPSPAPRTVSLHQLKEGEQCVSAVINPIDLGKNCVRREYFHLFFNLLQDSKCVSMFFDYFCQQPTEIEVISSVQFFSNVQFRKS